MMFDDDAAGGVPQPDNGYHQQPGTISLDNDDDPIMNSPLSFVRSFNFPVYLIFWHMFAIIWDIIYYVDWARFNDTLLNGSPSSKLILAMLIIANLSYWAVAGPFLLYAAKYAQTKKKANWATQVAIIVLYLLSELPSFIIHFTILHNLGWVDTTQGIAAVLRVVSGFGSSYLVWQIYMSWMTKFLTRSVWSPADELAAMAKKREKDFEMRQRKNMPVYR